MGMEFLKQNINQLVTDRAIRSFSGFWSWWTAELFAMLPEKMRAALQPAGQRLLLVLDGTDIVASRSGLQGNSPVARFPLSAGAGNPAGDDIRAALEHARETLLYLSRDRALVKPMVLPLATEENLREVLAFEMDRQTPFSADQVYYDYIVTRRNQGERQLELCLVLTPRRELDDVLEALASQGIHPDRVCVQDTGSKSSPDVNLLPDKYREGKSTLPKPGIIVLGALVLLLLVTAVALPLLAQKSRINTLEPLLESAQARASAASKLRDSVNTLQSGTRFLVEKKQSSMMALQVINELTRILPDDTWVQQLQIRGNEVQIQGQSASAAALIPLLEASGILHTARMRSPVTQVPRSNRERFNLSVQIGSPGT